MPRMGVALVTGATGQDGFLLVRHLLGEGWEVHATVRPRATTVELRAEAPPERLVIHEIDLRDRAGYRDLVAATRPAELYNYAGQSSVAASFADPRQTWETNADAVFDLLECVRSSSPETRVYQASSTDIFGWSSSEPALHNEDSPLAPMSPYAAAKAAAQLICGVYRRSFGIRAACGIASSHESARRSSAFLSGKVTEHVRHLRALPAADALSHPPLMMGNLKVRRDWGYAPDYVEGAQLVCRQIAARARHLRQPPEADVAASYRDYVLGTGELRAVWELVDAAFALGGFELDWDLDGDDAGRWRARFRGGERLAVAVDRVLVRPNDPAAIGTDPARAKAELGWTSRAGLTSFLRDMLPE